jgi:hypothetical protein
MMKQTKTLMMLFALIWISAAANAAKKTPDAQPDIAIEDFSHQVRVRWIPQIDSGGRQVVQLTIEYTRSADTEATDGLSVVVMPSNRVLMRVIDPRSQSAAGEKKIESAARTSSYVTAYARLDRFSETVILPYVAGEDDRILIGVKTQNGVRVIARTKANLADAVTFTATTESGRLSSPAFRSGVIRAEDTMYCYESDWCQERCVLCSHEPYWDSGICEVTCYEGNGDHVCFFDDDPCPADHHPIHPY